MGIETLASMLKYFANDRLEQIVLSHPAGSDNLIKIKIRPLLLKGSLVFQSEEFTDKQAFHRNLSGEELESYVDQMLNTSFRQAEVTSAYGTGLILVSKKGKRTVKVKRNPQPKITAFPASLSHNRKKRYILEEGIPVPFLEDLGVMTADGKIVRSRYDKFRQINRFLEFIEDILPRLDKAGESTIIDFGCGKSYLTFAMYYYLHHLKGYQVHIIGLDLKDEVIQSCNRLAEQYRFENLQFYHGDIASYEGVDHVDMVVTLHACDTATDFAIAKAIGWGAKVILSVPCCQHELNGQMENELMNPVFRYGLIKERMAALYTDALRAELLENQGYRTQILEFIDMEHTPKNILIRAVYEGRKKENRKELDQLLEFLQIHPTLYSLLEDPIKAKK